MFVLKTRALGRKTRTLLLQKTLRQGLGFRIKGLGFGIKGVGVGLKGGWDRGTGPGSDKG